MENKIKRLIVNLTAVFVIVLGGMTFSASTTAMSYNAFDKCGECETNDPGKCCSLKSDGSCFTHKCIDINLL